MGGLSSEKKGSEGSTHGTARHFMQWVKPHLRTKQEGMGSRVRSEAASTLLKAL